MKMMIKFHALNTNDPVIRRTEWQELTEDTIDLFETMLNQQASKSFRLYEEKEFEMKEMTCEWDITKEDEVILEKLLILLENLDYLLDYDFIEDLITTKEELDSFFE